MIFFRHQRSEPIRKPTNHRDSSNEHDVIVIGGDPSGTSAASILAEYGHRVLVLERAKFPRCHTGKSFIPSTLGPLERLGLIPKRRDSRWIREHLGTGECEGEFWVTSEYSRHSRCCASPGLLLVGDAFAFLDPVFSSGVMLALKSGVLAGEFVHEGLVDGDLSPERFTAYGAQMREGVENMRELVYAFHRTFHSRTW